MKTNQCFLKTCKKSKKRQRYLFQKQGVIGRFFDRMMQSLMRWLLGNSNEEPQQTHPWNWKKLPKELAMWMLRKDLMPAVAADPKATARTFLGIPTHHFTRFGGWKQYAVLTPAMRDWSEGETWYVGWIDEAGRCCVSIIPLTTSVRMLRGPKKSRFFALNRRHRQIPLYASGFGEIGHARPEHARLPLR